MGTTAGESQLQSGNGYYQRLSAHLDPMGADVGFNPPPEPEPPPANSHPWEFGDPEEVDWITIDGVTGPANHFPPGMVAAASRCPSGGCGPNRTEHGWEFWTALADGYEGFMPMGANYAGGGHWSWQTQDDRRRREAGKRNRSGKGEKPKLKNKSPRRPVNEAEIERLQPEFSNVDPPRDRDPLAWIAFAFRMVALTKQRLQVVGLTEAQESDLGKRLTYMMASSTCVDAFRSAKLATPAEVLRDRGLVYSHFSLLHSSSNNQRLGITETQRQEVVKNENLFSHGTTVTKWTGQPVYTFWRDISFGGGDYDLDENTAHEAMHAVGVGDHTWYPLGFGFSYGHDLTDYDDYGLILNACRIKDSP